jgi:2-polyprenyl-3-methyl-5-hydroxy-6-metoxy-1,4-benzoquinol methylase
MKKVLKNDFDVASIPGMRAKLEAHYKRFREIQKKSQAETIDPAIVIERKCCPLCETPTSESLLLFVKNGFRHTKCDRCDLVYTVEVADEISDREQYKQNSFTSAYGELKSLEDFKILEIKKAVYYLQSASKFSNTPKKLLDIGCSTGSTLAAAQELGLAAFGIEPNPEYITSCRARGLQNTVSGYFPDDLPDEWGNFDFICIFDLLEHMHDPIDFLNTVKKRLLPGGRLLVQVPNENSLLIKTEGSSNSNYCVGHWQHFTIDTLAKALQKSGQIIVHLETVISETDRISSHDSNIVRNTIKTITGIDKDPNSIDSDFIYRNNLGYKIFSISM